MRLEVQDTITPRVLDLLTEEIDVPEEDVFYVPGLLDLASPVAANAIFALTAMALDLSYIIPIFLCVRVCVCRLSRLAC